VSTQVILPPEAIYSLELQEQLEKVERLRERGADLKAFDDALKQIDERLSLVQASPNATAPGLTPGYWHVRRQNDPPTMDSYLILTAPDGSFVEPHSGFLDWLRGCDLQRPGALDDLQKQQYAKERERQRRKELLHEERVDEFLSRYKAHANPGVLFGDNKWTWRAGARTG
jgi:hypothetical protein